MIDTDIQKSDRADVNHLYPPLDEEERAALFLVCRDIGLSNDEFEAIEFETKAFRFSEESGKHGIKTPSDRRKALAEVQKLAKALSVAIEDLHPFDRTKLWGWMPPANRPPDGPDCHRVEWIGFEAGMLANAAIELRRSTVDTGLKSGRSETRIYYAEHLDGIVEIVKNKMTIGRGGPFERLCNAVFIAAGVPSNAEGTIRFLMQP